MANKMLIDAAHPEETRVVVLRGKKVDEFDFESASRKQLRGNIYLAKITRVEPSLQAAFVDYGGNRHGFLAFSEIHPDYYQIPVADRLALLEEEAEEQIRAAKAEDEYGNRASRRAYGDEALQEQTSSENQPAEAQERTQPQTQAKALEASTGSSVTSDIVSDQSDAQTSQGSQTSEQNSAQPDHFADEPHPVGLVEDQGVEDVDSRSDLQSEDENDAPHEDDEDAVESVGSVDALEEVPLRTRRRKKIYKIQEVIKRRQIILVQVVKEERGNKGAALTTYLSLAGRHTVLMPNTARGGGISRKITNPADRKRLRKIADELEVPEGSGLIIRTAGASRTKAEIKRDYEYLLRLWENVRDLTLQSSAPALVYEEGNLIKRSIRDLYTKEIDEVLVAGDEAHKEAKNFMRMIMPSHAKNVQLYKEAEPLFIRYQIERQLNEMYSPYVTLPSGGYIVINQTEALVAIDVNSGRSTREHNIEDTALRTNSEAAEEIARQLRLRDLAGLIVIDFIDMEERRNKRNVERKVKECLRNDRARIQVGRISHFGLLEMSRQRLRTGVLEGSTTQCPHCQGTGIIRSVESVSLSVLRALEDTLLSGEVSNLTATTSVEVALYILNQKRPYLKDIEARYNLTITVVADQHLQGANFKIERDNAPDQKIGSNIAVKMDWGFQPPEETAAKPLETVEVSEDEDSENGRRNKRRRRRRRRGERGRDERSDQVDFASDDDDDFSEDEGIEEINGDGQQEPRHRPAGRRSHSQSQPQHRGSRDRSETFSSTETEDDNQEGREQDSDERRADSEDEDGRDRSRRRRRGRRGGRRHRGNRPEGENRQGESRPGENRQREFSGSDDQGSDRQPHEARDMAPLNEEMPSRSIDHGSDEENRTDSRPSDGRDRDRGRSRNGRRRGLHGRGYRNREDGAGSSDRGSSDRNRDNRESREPRTSSERPAASPQEQKTEVKPFEAKTSEIQIKDVKEAKTEAGSGHGSNGRSHRETSEKREAPVKTGSERRETARERAEANSSTQSVAQSSPQSSSQGAAQSSEPTRKGWWQKRADQG